MICRDATPNPEDCTDKWRALAHQYYDQLIAMGGRPTRPIKQYPDCKTTTTDGNVHYRDEYENIEVILETDSRRSYSHWRKELKVWDKELCRWTLFKEGQRLYNECGRSQLDLDLEDTDVALLEVLSKLNDWQELQSIHHREVHEAERFVERCQQGNARSHNAMVTATISDATFEIREPTRGWVSEMRHAEERLKASQDELMWVTGQLTEVIAEACSSIAATPKLQRQLEAKFEKKTRAIYHTLQQEGAIPSHTIYAPNKDSGLPGRLQHWISESTAFIAELRNWRIFKWWRRNVRDAGNLDQEGRKVLSEGDSCAELFEDFVKYQQYELDKTASWVECWRRQVRHYRDLRTPLWLYEKPGTSDEGSSDNISEWSAYMRNAYGDDRADDEHDENDDNSDDSSDDDGYFAQARRAKLYSKQAKEKIPIVAQRLEESKEKLQSILADIAQPSTSDTAAAITRVQTPPAPSKSPSSESLSKSGRPLKRRSEGKTRRRSKKQKVRRMGAKSADTKSEQHALPSFSLGSDHMKKEDGDIQMSDDAKDSSPIEGKKSYRMDSQDTVVPDIEQMSTQTPLSPPHSNPDVISDSSYRKLPSQNSPSPASRKTRSATKPDQVSSGKISKIPSKNRPLRKPKASTQEQQLSLLNAVSTENHEAGLALLRKNELETYPTPPTSRNNKTGQSSEPPILTPRKTRSAKFSDPTPSNKIHKHTIKKNPPKKAKSFTEEQQVALLSAVSTEHPATAPTSHRRDEPEPYPTPPTSTNQNATTSPNSQYTTSSRTQSTKKIDQAALGKILEKPRHNKQPKKPKAFTEEQTKTLSNAATGSCSSICTNTPRRSERLRKKVAAGEMRVRI